MDRLDGRVPRGCLPWRTALMLGVCASLLACSTLPPPDEDPTAAVTSAPTSTGGRQTSPEGALAAGVFAGAWSEQTLPGKRRTDYRAVKFDGRACLHAQAQSSASMFRRKLLIESTDLGRLKFSWRVPALIEAADLTRREGEDAPVRVVLAFDGDHDRLDFRTRAMFEMGEVLTGERPPFATLMYVWENHQPRESLILNPRTDRIRKIVVESGAHNLGRWLSYERDVVADYRRAFGEAPGRLIGIAVMTDSDNTASNTEAHYADLTLLSRLGQTL
ncbi:MAG: hypothetical protein RL375_4403 [Pseudomonadota bacterium]